METADVIVIGSGQGGIPFAADFAKEGRRVVLFERDVLGGSCINYGCTPSKAFLAAAHAAGRARLAAKLGVHAQVEVDFPAVMERVRGIRDQFNQGTKWRLKSAGVNVVCAEASFTDHHTVTGGDVTVEAPIVVINTGTSSLIPDIPGLADTPFLTNRNFSDRVLGYAVYTEPQVGRVGMTLEQAQQQGINAHAVTMPMAHIARAIEWGHDLGFYRMVVDRDTDRILGATLVGYETAELSCSSFKPYCQELQNPCSATILVATDTQFKCVTA
jgi:pyruvate/2-oxoglutarate dehydrogenase complex dihydrolipoamide dehydrogenase (E3) component